MKEPARKYIFLVFCFEVAIIGMQIYSMGQDTWWFCDLTARHAAIMNANETSNSTRVVKVSIKMRTSLEDTCWYAQQVDGGSVTVNDTLIPRPITKCMMHLYGSLERPKILAIDKARADGMYFVQKVPSQHTTLEQRFYDVVLTF